MSDHLNEAPRVLAIAGEIAQPQTEAKS